MSNPKLADNILKVVYEKRIPTPQGVASHLEVSQSVVEETMKDIYKDKPEWFNDISPIKGDYFQLLIIPGRSEEIKRFLYAENGYSGLEERTMKKQQREEIFRKKEIENLDAVTAQAKQAIDDSLFSKRMAWAALIVAIVSAVISLVK